jgi:hypothetical protein
MNSIVSDPGCVYFSCDLKDFYLNTELAAGAEEYMWMDTKHISDAVADEYGLRSYYDNGRICFQICQALYGLKNAGYLSKVKLDNHLLLNGYREDTIVPAVYRHNNGTVFILVVDDFAVKCKSLAAKQHFLTTIESGKYKGTVDHQLSKFVGYTLEFSAGKVEMWLEGYGTKLELRFHDMHATHEDSPMVYTPPQYGAKVQQISQQDLSQPLTTAEVTLAQEILGCVLHFARMVLSTALPACNQLAIELADRQSSILPKLKRLLGYVYKHKDDRLVFHASDMIYQCTSDVSFNSVSKGRSRAGGHGHWGKSSDPTFINGPASAMSRVLDVVAASAMEGEYGAAFIWAKNTVWMRAVGNALGHPQLHPTVHKVDNESAIGIANDTMKTSKSKSIDLRFHWLRDRIRQKQFVLIWEPTAKNLADIFTKALPVHEHKIKRRTYVREVSSHSSSPRSDRSIAWRNATAATVV